MRPICHSQRLSDFVAHAALASIIPFASTSIAVAQNLTQPVYHVASETSAAPAAASSAPHAAAPAAAAPAAAPGTVFNLTQQPGEHPAAPLLRVSNELLANIDQNVKDYTCSFIKRERLDGELTEPQTISLKVRNQPFSVYMYFLKPYQGREVLFVNGQNNNDLLVLECGWKRMAGKLPLDPNGTVAMSGQKHPITQVGMRNLVSEWITASQAELQLPPNETVVTVTPTAKIGDRSATLIQIEHPQEQKYYRANVTRFFLDNELKLPIYYDAYLWPEKPGGERLLSESYWYANLKINTGLTDQDFDPNNGKIFK